MDNCFKWFGICTGATNISEYSDRNKCIQLCEGDLIKVSPQSMPYDKDKNRLITLFSQVTSGPVAGDVRNGIIYLCPESKFDVVNENLQAYLIVETDSFYRSIVYRNQEHVLSLKNDDLVNISMKDDSKEFKVCCKVEYIGEVPEYGKGIYFCLRASEVRNDRVCQKSSDDFIEKYAKGSRAASLIIITASALFEPIKFVDIINRPIVLNVAPLLNKPIPEKEKPEAELKALKQRLAGGQSENTPSNKSGAIHKNALQKIKQSEEKKLQFNRVSLSCSICRNYCPALSAILLTNCGHVVCYDCLTNHISSIPADSQMCPFINKIYKCNSIIQLYELNGLNSDETKDFITKNRNKRNAYDREPAKNNVWSCSKCTYENTINATKCNMCEELRGFQPIYCTQCMNCFDNCSPGVFFTVPECNHNVCNNCLMVYLDYKLKRDVDKAECPIKLCDYVLKPRDILEMFIQLDRFYIKNRMKFFDICVLCQVAHSNISCKQFHGNLISSREPINNRLRAKYEQLVRIGDAGFCPKCRIVTVRQDHKQQYCFTCYVVLKPKHNKPSWQCGICCNQNDRDSNICRVCGKYPKTKAGTNISMAKCMFCTLEIKFIGGVTLDCSHFFCKACLEPLVITNDTMLRCPYEGNNKKCLSSIDEFEIHQIMGGPPYKRHKIHLIREVAKQTENSVHCLDENCTGWSLKDVLYDSNMFICTVCRKPNCLSCKIVHAGMTCAIYNDPIKRKQFLEPKPKQYGDLLKLDENQVIKNTEPFTCSICYLEYYVGEAIVLRECLHVICKECLTGYVKHTDEVEAKCPFQDDNYKCESILLECEIKAAVDQQTYNQYIERWYTIGKNIIEKGIECKTVNCNGFWENDENINEQECPLCKAINCLNCQAIHPEMKCDEYQTSIDTKKKLEEEIAAGIGMRCPKCRIIIIRTAGCDWLQCTMCRTEICWVTKGARWGPGGRGDTSGGCKCRVNGKKVSSALHELPLILTIINVFLYFYWWWVNPAATLSFYI